jgi:hypothetical protein
MTKRALGAVLFGAPLIAVVSAIIYVGGSGAAISLLLSLLVGVIMTLGLVLMEGD